MTFAAVYTMSDGPTAGTFPRDTSAKASRNSAAAFSLPYFYERPPALMNIALEGVDSRFHLAFFCAVRPPQIPLGTSLRRVDSPSLVAPLREATRTRVPPS